MTRGPGKDAGRTGRAAAAGPPLCLPASPRGRGQRGEEGGGRQDAWLGSRHRDPPVGAGRWGTVARGLGVPRGPAPRPLPPGPQVGLLTTPPEPSVYVRPRCADAGGVKGLLRGEPGGRRGEGSSPAPRRGSGPGTRRAALGGDAFLTVLVGNLLPPPLSQIPLQDPRSHAEGASPPRRRRKGR